MKESRILKTHRELSFKKLGLLRELELSKRFEAMSKQFEKFYIIQDGFLMDNLYRHTQTRTPEQIAGYLFLRRTPSNRVLWVDPELSKRVRTILANRYKSIRKPKSV